MPFGKYSSFKDCINKNQDKKNPAAYCAVIQRKIEKKNAIMMEVDSPQSEVV